jgi:lipopolysaccharide/colanic/teichoic acid biosynthesis glycosyltransferase
MFPFLKRLLDVLFSGVLILLLLPIGIVLTLLVRWKMRSPILFFQDRSGLNGRLFRLYKFRTMRDATGRDGRPMPDAERLTPLGRWMRKWSLDELPELFNVLKGDMSLVGPRPLLPQYLGRYTPEQARRHEVKPGLTGWAQVNGRNAITWEEKFSLDVWYIDNRSFLLDLKILAMTLWKVVSREGISAHGEATMPEFMGTVSTSGKSGNA